MHMLVGLNFNFRKACITIIFFLGKPLFIVIWHLLELEFTTDKSRTEVVRRMNSYTHVISNAETSNCDKIWAQKC